MRTTTASILSIPFFLAHLSTAFSIDCKQDIVVNSKKFDFSKLDAPHTVSVIDKDRPPAIYNMTWTVNICRPLKKISGIEAGDQCRGSTNICGIERSYNPVDDPDKKRELISEVISLAGSWSTDTGDTLRPTWTRLKTMDSKKDGLQLEIEGGTYAKLQQKAVIEFQCDKDRTGNEKGSEKKDDKQNKRKDGGGDDEDDEDGEDDKKNAPSLTFVSYGPVDTKDNKIMDVLRLNWRTKYACENYERGDDDDEDEEKKGSWGFFTWFILIAFLGIAAYLIFGSWLNYNRYGARGWDLLPHGDTIRDVPYLFKDWSRKVADTVSGGGSRGGYSAV